MRNGLRKVAESVGEYAGIPLPVDGERLIVEPRHPLYAVLSQETLPNEDDVSIATLRNSFWSKKYSAWVYIWNEPDGSVHWGAVPKNRLAYHVSALGLAEVWGLEQERNAMLLLANLITHVQYKQYVLTGSFVENSRRSKIIYIFRRLRPTLAIGLNNKLLAALCMHPIAYYEDTHAGAMTPTDDVIAHLMLMRGDEHMFWKRCNQHAAHMPTAGV